MRRLRAALPIAACALALGSAPAAWGQTATTGVPVAPGVTAPAATAPPATAPGPTATTGVPVAPGATATTPPATATAPTATAPTTTSTTAAAPATGGGGSSGPSALLVGLAVLLALGALTVAGWGLARLTAWEPRWLPAARHSIGEAGYRTGASWAEFRDWLRPRR